jgi:hypothetical protein
MAQTWFLIDMRQAGEAGKIIKDGRKLPTIDRLTDYDLVTQGNRRGEIFVRITPRGVRWLKGYARW